MICRGMLQLDRLTFIVASFNTITATYDDVDSAIKSPSSLMMVARCAPASGWLLNRDSINAGPNVSLTKLNYK